MQRTGGGVRRLGSGIRSVFFCLPRISRPKKKRQLYSLAARRRCRVKYGVCAQAPHRFMQIHTCSGLSVCGLRATPIYTEIASIRPARRGRGCGVGAVTYAESSQGRAAFAADALCNRRCVPVRHPLRTVVAPRHVPSGVLHASSLVRLRCSRSVAALTSTRPSSDCARYDDVNTVAVFSTETANKFGK
jgi:hypothetical protein